MMGFGNNGGNNQNPQFNQNDPVFDMFGGFQNFQSQFNQFVGNMQQSMNPNRREHNGRYEKESRENRERNLHDLQ